MYMPFRGVESELESPPQSPGFGPESTSLSFEGDSDSRPYLPHLDFCVIFLQSV